MAKEGQPKKSKLPTAKKRDIQNQKKRLVNRIFKSQVRTAIRKFEKAVENNSQEEVSETLRHVYSLMDKGVKKGIFKRNNASRKKSRLAAKAIS